MLPPQRQLSLARRFNAGLSKVNSPVAAATQRIDQARYSCVAAATRRNPAAFPGVETPG
jgi:hypothetical protein